MNGGEGIFDTLIEASGDVAVTYSRKIVDYPTPSDITEFLKHEACHVFTLSASAVSVPQTHQEMVDYLVQHMQCYDEYLAHGEFIRRWPDEKAFMEFKIRELDNYARLLYTLRKMVREGRVANLPYVFQSLSIILQDAVYFRLADTEKMRAWTNECNASAIYEFYDFWFQDFEYILHGSFNRDIVMKLAQLSAVLSMSVDINELLLNNTISFDASATRVYQDFWDSKEPAEQRTLIRTWMNRIR